MNGMTAKELEQEKLTVNRMCLELKAKRQVSRNRPAGGGSICTGKGNMLLLTTCVEL